MNKILVVFWALPLYAMSLEIVLPNSPTVFERTAAEELVLHLKDVYGGDVSQTTEKDAKGGLAIHVGGTSLAKANGIDCAKMDKEEWRLKSLDGKRMIAAGGSPRGVIYSAYELLERLYGVMWLDHRFTIFPKERLDAWPKTDVGGKPDFHIRSIHSYFGGDAMARWLCKSRNRINYFHDEERSEPFKAMQKYGIFIMYGLPEKACHTYYYYTKDLPPEDEDCFSMNKKGERVRSKSGSGPGQICLSNPKTVDWFEKKLRGYIAADRKVNPDNPPCLYEVSANDNASECQCAGCQELAKKYDSYGGAVLHFMNALAERVAKDYPDIKLQMFAYNTAAKAPKDIKAHPNVLVRLAQLGGEWTGGYRDSIRSLRHPINAKALAELYDWTEIATVSIWDYWVTYCGTASSICYEAISDNLKLYHEKGIENFFVEHEFPLEGFFYPLRIWLGYRFMYDSSQDIDRLAEKFMAGYYGEKSAPFMMTMLSRMREEQGKVTENLGKLSFRMRPDFTKELFDFCDSQIEKALSVAENADYRKHIIMERVSIDYAKLRRFKDEASPDLKAFCDRICNDCALLTPEWGGSGIPSTLKMYEGCQVEIPMPAEIDGCKVVHQITWKDTLDYVPVRRSYDDPEAAGGRAIKAEDQTTGHSGFSFGYYVPKTKKFVQQIDPLPIDKIAQDGKYHYYKIGKVTLDETGFFHAHRSWTDQWFAEHLYVPGGDNDYIAYISLKAVGPAYVKDSKEKTSAIWSDRVLLVKEK